MDNLDNTFTSYNKDTNTMYLLNPSYHSSRYKKTQYSNILGVYNSSHKKLFDIEMKHLDRIRIVKNSKVLVKFKKVKYFLLFLQSLLKEKIFINSSMFLNEFFGKLGSRGIKFYKKYRHTLNDLQYNE